MPSALHQNMVRRFAEAYGFYAPGFPEFECPLRRRGKPWSFGHAVRELHGYSDFELCQNPGVPDLWRIFCDDFSPGPTIVVVEVEKALRVDQERLDRYSSLQSDLDDVAETSLILITVDYRGGMANQSFDVDRFASLGTVGDPIDFRHEECRWWDAPWLDPKPCHCGSVHGMSRAL